jgi:hypothetical protein
VLSLIHAAPVQVLNLKQFALCSTKKERVIAMAITRSLMDLPHDTTRFWGKAESLCAHDFCTCIYMQSIGHTRIPEQMVGVEKRPGSAGGNHGGESVCRDLGCSSVKSNRFPRSFPFEPSKARALD